MALLAYFFLPSSSLSNMHRVLISEYDSTFYNYSCLALKLYKQKFIIIIQVVRLVIETSLMVW